MHILSNLAAVSLGLFALASALPAAAPLEGTVQLEKRAPGQPTARGYQFYRSTSNLLQWAVLSVSTPELRPNYDLRENIHSTAGTLIAETRTQCVRAGSTVGNAAGEAKWTAVYDAITNTIGIVVDASGSAVSAFEFEHLQQYLESWFKAQGVGWSTQMTDDVTGLIQRPVKREAVDTGETGPASLVRRQDYCEAGSVSVLESIESLVASLPTDSFEC